MSVAKQPVRAAGSLKFNKRSIVEGATRTWSAELRVARETTTATLYLAGAPVRM